MFSSLVYQFLLTCYSAAAAVGSLFSPKVEDWRRGRKTWYRDWKEQLDKIPGYGKRPLLWVHASSLGEFEQAWPVAEALKQYQPSLIITVSFFSPSGLRVIEKKKMADACGYLPFDNDSRLPDFVSMLHPQLIIWSKYDYWYNTLKIIHKKQIPILLVSSIFRQEQPFFKSYGSLHREMIRFFSHVFVQDEASYNLLKQIGLDSDFVSVSGDTRFDRVSALSTSSVDFPLVSQWANRFKTILVAGSTWPEDHDLFADLLKNNGLPESFALILAPHEISKENMEKTKRIFPESITYSSLQTGNFTTSENVLIIDNVGMLSRLYAYGHLAYVGGGFSKTGVHNVLEPAAFGKPVLFGPNHKKYREVGLLLAAGGGFEIEGASAIKHWINEASKQSVHWRMAGEQAENFIRDHAGATAIILNYVQQNRLLINA